MGKTSKPTALLEESVVLGGSLKKLQKQETQHLSLSFVVTFTFPCWSSTASFNSCSLVTAYPVDLGTACGRGIRAEEKLGLITQRPGVELDSRLRTVEVRWRSGGDTT